MTGQSVMAVFTANQATVSGRDSLIVNNVELSTAAITPVSKNSHSHVFCMTITTINKPTLHNRCFSAS
jgi:hypothetical protein